MSSSDALVFPTAGGRPRDKDNVRKRVHGVVQRTNQLRTKHELPELPPISPHALRRTYISLLIEAGRRFRM